MHGLAVEREQIAAPVAPRRPLRIATLGWHGIGNLGNDGLIEAMFRFLRREFPDAKITAICPGTKVIAEKFGVNALQIRWEPKHPLIRLANKLALKIPSALFNWAYTRRHIGKFDFLIVPGSGIIDDYRTNFLGRPSVLRRWIAAAKQSGVKIVMVSIGADPVRNPVSRWIVKPIIEMASYRSYRDEGSRAYLQSAGFDKAASPVYPDLAWGLPAPPEPAFRDKTRLTIGVGVMAYHGWNDIESGHKVHRAYVDKVVDFVDWLADQGHRIRLLVGDKADMRVVNAVTQNARAVGTHAWIEPTPALSLHEIMEQTLHIDLVVATRFHNILCALKLGRPTIALSYMPKCSELLDAAGMPGYWQMIEDFDLEKLKQQFADMLANRDRLESIIRDRCIYLQDKLAEQEALLAREVLVR